jgi:hypothetical protein
MKSVNRFAFLLIVLAGSGCATGARERYGDEPLHKIRLTDRQFASLRATPQLTSQLPVRARETTVEQRFAVRLNTVESGAFAALGFPMAAIAGDINLGAGIAIGPVASWGPGKLVNPGEGVDAGFWSLGVHGTYYFSGKALQDGFFVRGYYSHYTAWAQTRPMSADDVNGQGYGSLVIHGFGGGAGYHWVWDSGFSLTLGLGLARYRTGLLTVGAEGGTSESDVRANIEVEIPDYLKKGVILPMPEVTFGWAF